MDYFPLDTEYNLIYMLPGIYQPLHSLSTSTLRSKITEKGSVSEISNMVDVPVSQQEPKMPGEPAGASSTPPSAKHKQQYSS